MSPPPAWTSRSGARCGSSCARSMPAGTTIILTTHYLEEAENLCRHIAIIDGGRIIERDRMSNVLRKLQTEIFVLNLRNPVAVPPRAARLRSEARRRPHARGRESSKSRTSTTSSRACQRPASKCSACATRSTGSRSCSCGWWRAGQYQRATDRHCQAESRVNPDAIGFRHHHASASSAASCASGARRSCRRR